VRKEEIVYEMKKELRDVDERKITLNPISPFLNLKKLVFEEF